MQGFTQRDIEAMKMGPEIEAHSFALATTAKFSKLLPGGRIAQVVCPSIYNIFAAPDPIKRGDFENIWDVDGVLSAQAPWKESGTDGAVTLATDSKYGDYAVELAHDAAALRWYQYFSVPSWWVGGKAHVLFWSKDTDALAVYCEWSLQRMKSGGTANDWWDAAGGSWTTETWNDITQSATYARTDEEWDVEGVGPYILCFRPEGAAAKITRLDDVGIGKPATASLALPANQAEWIGVAGGPYRISGIAAAGTPNIFCSIH